MTALLDSLFGALSPLWEMSLTAVYVTAVVAVLRLLLRKRAPKQVLCLLWLVVFARLLIPVSLESPLSILPGDEQVQLAQELPAKLIGGEGQGAAAQDPVQNQPGAIPVSQGGSEPGAAPAFPALTVPEGVTSSAPQPEPEAGFPWRALLAGVWLAGAAAMCLYALVSYLGLKSRLYDAIRAEDGAWEHPAVSSPFILGVLRPRIYLPAGLWGMPRKFILCHERAHLRRLDHIVKPICWAALALHWFNPAVWAAFTLMSKDIEAACDEAVIRQLGPRVKADYSATLLSLATNGRVPAPCPLAFDEGDAKGRIQNVLRYRRPALWIVVVSVVMAIMAAVCLLTDPVSAKEADPDPDASESQGMSDLLDPWMEEVLVGRQNFTSMERGGAVNIDLLNGAYPEDAPFNTITLSKFAIVDLDRDGINELVLWPSIDGDDSENRISTLGYLVLRRQGDAVYSYDPSYRSFYQLKTDGTFTVSGGATHNGYAALRFTDDGYAIHEITISDGAYDDNNEYKAVYFVNGVSATLEEFNSSIRAHADVPDVTWYVFEDGQLLEAGQRNSNPANVDDLGLSLPDFLDNEQQALYCDALITYSHLFGTSSELVDPNGYGADPVTYNGRRYYPDTGVYDSWEEFEGVILASFTENFWHTRNKDDLYVNINGTMHYLDWARGSGGYNENFPETFRLVEKTDDTISFIMTGYYSDARQFDGITDEQREAWLAAGWEYSIEFPMRLVRTENGWRFDEFHNARTDNGLLEFGAKTIANPYAPPAPPASEDILRAEQVVISELNGMQLVSVGHSYRMNWKGQSYPVGPDGIVDEYPGCVEDFDEDGQPEVLFNARADGSYPFTIYDIVDGQLKGYTLPDLNTSVYTLISVYSVAAYNPDTGNLTMTFPWGEGDSRRYITINTTLSSDFFTGCEELADGRPLRMSVTRGSINGMSVPRGFSYRASVAITDGTTFSPEVGYMWFGVHYSDNGFEIRTPEESDFGTGIRA